MFSLNKRRWSSLSYDSFFKASIPLVPLVLCAQLLKGEIIAAAAAATDVLVESEYCTFLGELPEDDFSKCGSDKSQDTWLGGLGHVSEIPPSPPAAAAGGKLEQQHQQQQQQQPEGHAGSSNEEGLVREPTFSSWPQQQQLGAAGHRNSSSSGGGGGGRQSQDQQQRVHGVTNANSSSSRGILISHQPQKQHQQQEQGEITVADEEDEEGGGGRRRRGWEQTGRGQYSEGPHVLQGSKEMLDAGGRYIQDVVKDGWQVGW